ncbi:MAG: GIY-YIG nuclease family protein [Bacteroidetes bacterium]|nr:GIY-YIG nuclease family protein [Bacteroidota bacterium]MCL4816100.1 GIY-YIG nuclease family protein [Flavobacteriales bacterium]NOG95259.1 GIY-YIG nuclease family protein [Bacteroidota bacterium]GIK69819.1 MAG: excinuclease ABC subunit C [Bacteroidota bacterium]
MKYGYVYIMSNLKRTTLYIGVTNDIERRVQEHKFGKGEGSKFTEKYKLKYLIYFEVLPDIKTAIEREKQLKNWHRQWKWNLIKTLNPDLKDISDGIDEP